jgi:hypothetical protein
VQFFLFFIWSFDVSQLVCVQVCVCCVFVCVCVVVFCIDVLARNLNNSCVCASILMQSHIHSVHIASLQTFGNTPRWYFVLSFLLAVLLVIGGFFAARNQWVKGQTALREGSLD